MADARDRDRPQACRHGVIVRELADEAVVFDERTKRAHCLNATSWRVWHACDGSRTPGSIARDLEFDERVVALALDLLGRSGLLEEPRAPSRELVGLTRRQAVSLIKAASAAVAVPAVVSILAPTVAEAASCVQRGGICGHNDSQVCCPGLRCTSDHCQ